MLSKILKKKKSFFLIKHTLSDIWKSYFVNDDFYAHYFLYIKSSSWRFSTSFRLTFLVHFQCTVNQQFLPIFLGHAIPFFPSSFSFVEPFFFLKVIKNKRNCFHHLLLNKIVPYMWIIVDVEHCEWKKLSDLAKKFFTSFSVCFECSFSSIFISSKSHKNIYSFEHMWT